MTIKDFQIIRKVLPWQSTTCQMPGPVEFITPEAGFAGNTPGANQLFEIADGEKHGTVCPSPRI